MSTEMPDEIAPPGCDDLAMNRAGQGVAAQAKVLRDKAPVRTFVARVLGVRTEERAFRVGAKGEGLVGDQLDRLPPPWHTLHSITLSESGTDLDHLVIGPAGVFSVNTKHHPGANVWVAGGTFLVNGQRQDYVRASRAEGRKVSRLLTKACGFEVVVTPVIAVVGAANGFTVKEQPADVVVCAHRHIVDWLRSQPASLSSGAVEAVYSGARLRSTWAGPGPERSPAPRDAWPSAEEPAAPVRGEFAPAVPSFERRKIVITYSGASGLRVLGDPRPHQAVTRSAGLRWSRAQRYWYLPKSRGRAPDTLLMEGLATQFGLIGFDVEVKWID